MLIFALVSKIHTVDPLDVLQLSYFFFHNVFRPRRTRKFMGPYKMTKCDFRDQSRGHCAIPPKLFRFVDKILKKSQTAYPSVALLLQMHTYKVEFLNFKFRKNFYCDR